MVSGKELNKNNIYDDINNKIIEIPEIYLDNLCTADNHTDLISEIQKKNWEKNLVLYGKDINIKIYESKYRYFEEKEFQSWSDLTGEDYYIKDKLYEPHAKLRSKAILRTRNFLCKNLKKKEFINALWYLSKYCVSPDELDLASEDEYTDIVKWIDMAENNEISKFKTYLNNKNSIIYKESIVTFDDLPEITKLTIIISDLDKLYNWLIENADFKSFHEKKIKVSGALLTLHIFARNLNEKIIKDVTEEEQKKLIEIENNLMANLSSTAYVKLHKEMFDFYKKTIDLDVLDHIKEVLNNREFLIDQLKIGFDLKKTNFLEQYLSSKDNLITKEISTKSVDKIEPEDCEIEENIKDEYFEITDILKDFYIILQDGKKDIDEMLLSSGKKESFIKKIKDDLDKPTKYKDLVSIFNSARELSKPHYIEKDINWNEIYIKLNIKNLKNEKNLYFKKILDKSNENQYNRNASLTFTPFTHYAKFNMDLQENILILENKEINIRDSDLISIDVRIKNEEYYIEEKHLYSDTIINFKKQSEKCGKICSPYFQFILTNNIALRINKL